MKKIKFLIIALASMMAMTSCEDMLTIDTGDKTYQNGNDTLYSYLGIIKCMQEVAERQVLLGELRGDLVSATTYVTDTLHAISNFDDPKDGSCSLLNISSYYSIINNCNFYLHYADTALVKSNIKFMKPEYAQVSAIRAWAYLQLVQLYGSVPFITEPISNLGIIKRFDYENNQATKDNLIDLILETGIEEFLDTEYPTYGSFNNGSTDIAARKLCIPIRIVLGDMYLLRGQDQDDYRQAAQYYYDYLKKTNGAVTAQYCTASKPRSGDEEFSFSTGGSGEGWGRWASSTSVSNANDVICIIPSSANKQFGTMLMRIADVFGYTPTSRQNVAVDEEAEESTTSGAITVDATYKAQVTPSEEFFTLANRQSYIYYDMSLTTPRMEEYECGDARYYNSYEQIIEEGEPYKLCSKAASGRNFYYTVPIYRRTLIWLRLAEAINRAGFPEMAFAILKDGLNYDNMPQIAQRMILTPVVDENGDTVMVEAYDRLGNLITKHVLDEDGNVIEVPDLVIKNDTSYEDYIRLNTYSAMYYVDTLELNNFFLDFSNELWDANYGIHARGCGYGSWNGIVKCTNITGYNDSIYYDFYRLVDVKAEDYPTCDKAQVIDKVENLICDELALELAFEGYRFTDLVRMAEHKEASGMKGAEWLAEKIAARNYRYDRFKDIEQGEVDQELYQKLLNKKNWYFTKPEWDVK